jgi:PAS domain S-box-containing protein
LYRLKGRLTAAAHDRFQPENPVRGAFMASEENPSLARIQQRFEEARARRIRAYFDLAERTARTGYWRTDLTNYTDFWSPGMFRLLESTPEQQQPSGTWLLEQLTPQDRDAALETIQKAIREKSSFTYRGRMRDPALAVQYVDTQGEVELDDRGNVVAVIGVCQDVTEKVRIEAERERAQRMYRVMAEQSSDLIMLYSPDRRILFASDALNKLIGRTVAEIDQGRFREFVHPEDLEEASKLADPPRPGEVVGATYRMQHRDGHYVWIETTIRSVCHGDDVENVVSVSRDVTERKNQELAMRAAREHAEAANNAKSRFLANMSHELRTPLNAIIGFTDMMRQRMFGPMGSQRYEEYATLIYDSGQLLLDLISDLLDMSKIEAGKLDLNMERVDLAGMVEDCVRLLQQRADNAGLELTTELPKGKLSLVADRRAIKQILLNLVSNAVKFTPAGGHVVITASVSGSRLFLKVRDNGIGISANDLPRIGKPFEQVVGDPMLAKGGTGLGLSLVRALSEKHGGAMKIWSREGVGTEVTIELPLAHAKRAPVAA